MIRPQPSAPATPPLPAIQAEPIRARTLILLRWMAVAGQAAAVAGALALGVLFPVVPVALLIAAAAVLNLWLVMRGPQRMSPRAVLGQLGFDLVQLSALLALTGGIANPFALLVLAPVTVSATVLDRRLTVALGLLAAALISAAGLWGWPIYDATGIQLELPPLLALGHWLAIVVGIGFFAIYARRVTGEISDTTSALFATQLALAREHRLQHLGGVVAAAAHELGTPLGTIKLIAAELEDELADRPDLAADLAVLRQSAARCAATLRSMGRAGKDDLLLRAGPLRVILEEAAEPHQNRGVAIQIDADGPDIRRDPGVIHALRNLIQNAVDYAATRIEITAFQDADNLTVTIRDDGPGFPAGLLPRLGESYPLGPRSVSTRKDGEGMGLGLFIARTLLERSGAAVDFANLRPGAQVTLRWPLALIAADTRQALGENPEITG
ncbi:MAG: ActS/PrrB/RegB family redox-sensitive histidine kinase [Paracoccus sp. (in: a-proteobacteria)]|uniref:ActS/PrrB/RegB family redox-sensitive histidine kinase n=1 Tax=Paracoccus sp. TaxID=267 RepID=UPI0026DEA780|nr:ActS/PrrB/RegB family redox-sensitive histidine kinase [Paracoccus sp. (in: a-proteobacteria)]MDO5632543.1 ActS/PrrB/RegB family redox-sensitive histidine kinase [Paracoccus sp. (in: a-proteobacteria)]